MASFGVRRNPPVPRPMRRLVRTSSNDALSCPGVDLGTLPRRIREHGCRRHCYSGRSSAIGPTRLDRRHRTQSGCAPCATFVAERGCREICDWSIMRPNAHPCAEVKSSRARAPCFAGGEFSAATVMRNDAQPNYSKRFRTAYGHDRSIAGPPCYTSSTTSPAPPIDRRRIAGSPLTVASVVGRRLPEFPRFANRVKSCVAQARTPDLSSATTPYIGRCSKLAPTTAVRLHALTRYPDRIAAAYGRHRARVATLRLSSTTKSSARTARPHRDAQSPVTVPKSKATTNGLDQVPASLPDVSPLGSDSAALRYEFRQEKQSRTHRQVARAKKCTPIAQRLDHST